MKKQILITLLIPATAILFSCGGESGETTEQDTTAKTTDTEVVKEAESSEFGSYTLTEMIPITNGKELTEQDTKYIEDSKARTIGNTTLTLKEDGTFDRMFPHPSGDGSTKTWGGTYVIEGELMKLNIDMEGETRTLEFKILEKTNDMISISSAFGQIEMNYIYTK